MRARHYRRPWWPPRPRLALYLRLNRQAQPIELELQLTSGLCHFFLNTISTRALRMVQ